MKKEIRKRFTLRLKASAEKKVRQLVKKTGMPMNKAVEYIIEHFNMSL